MVGGNSNYFIFFVENFAPLLSNFVVFPASEACDTLNELYDGLGTYRTFSSLHFCVFPSGKIISSLTLLSAGPSNGLLSPNVTCCRLSRFLISTSSFLSLHIWQHGHRKGGGGTGPRAPLVFSNYWAE